MEVTMNYPNPVKSIPVISVSCKYISSIMSVGHTRWVATVFSAFCLLCAPATVLAQTQLGTDIDGEAAGDGFGQSLSLSSDGNRLAIGTPWNNDNYGHVRIYEWSDSTWTQLGADIDGDATAQYTGFSVSLSSDGNRLAVGAIWSHDSGHARVYQWSGTVWVQLGTDIDGEAAGDHSGWSVSLSSDGNRLAIGADQNDGNWYESGHVRVYQWSDSTWTQLGADIDGEAAGDYSGMSVSLSSDGNRLAIGAPWNDGHAGHVRVYEWSDSTWTQLGTDIDGEAVEDFSGEVSLSSDGNRLAIGAGHNDGNGDHAGHVRVYEWSGMAWTQLGADIDGESAEDSSGAVSLSSDGSRLVIGAPGNDGNGSGSGHARVYQWSGTVWVQLGADIDGEAVGDHSGESVSLSSDGNRLAIGAGGNDGNGTGSGHVRIYDLSMFNVFRINPGLNDAWYNPLTDGQGFYINIFPDLGVGSLSWFTYDTELPGVDATANLGDPGHRWLTAAGPIVGNQVFMEIELTSGGLFDTFTEITRTDPPGSDGTIILTFEGCNSATVEYDIPSINRQGIVPIRRVANDNIVICEALRAD
jgi:hypothetical protein